MNCRLLFFPLLTLIFFSESVLAASSSCIVRKVNTGQELRTSFAFDNPAPDFHSGTATLKHRKFSFKEKLVLRVLKWRSRFHIRGGDEPTEKQKIWGRISFYLSLGAVFLLLFPYAALAVTTAIGILSLPLAVASLVFGIKSINGNRNVLGLLGVIISSSLLLLFLLGIVLLAILYSRGSF